MINGFQTTQMIYAFTKLGVPDLLSDGPQDAETLGELAGVDINNLRRLMHALESMGILVENNNTFSLTPMGEFLKSDHPDSMRPFILAAGFQASWNAYGNLIKSVQTGKNAFEITHNLDWFSYLETDDDALHIFNEHMATVNIQDAKTIAESYDFPESGTVVDVGGGLGILLETIINQYPRITGILYDRESVIINAVKRIKKINSENRIQCLSGDFFESVPHDGDVYILMNIINDWGDPHALQILKNCCKAMRADSRLLVITRIIEKNKHYASSTFHDISMMVYLGGRLRMIDEYNQLFSKANLSMSTAIQTNGQYSIIEAIPDEKRR